MCAAYILCHRTSKFNVVTHGEGTAAPPIPREQSSSASQFWEFSDVYAYTLFNTERPNSARVIGRGVPLATMNISRMTLVRAHVIDCTRVRRAVCQRELSVLFPLLSVIKVFALEFLCNSRSRAQACDCEDSTTS